MKKVALPFIALALILGLAAGAWISQPGLIILHAGSLAVPFDQLAEEFEETYGVNVVTEGAGSRTTIRKVTEMGKPADLIGVADFRVIEELMFPEYADWYICFATNEMVIAYRDGAPFADEIRNGERTWYDVLLNEDVTYGHSDPDADPCGYRALMVIQLAENYYTAPGLYDDLIHGQGMHKGRHTSGREVVMPKSVELLYLLDSGDLDYAFEYRSVAIQHGLEYLELPDEIDLSSLEYEEFYATAMVEVTGREPETTVTLTGAPIVYGVTIPKNAPHPERAIDFLKLLLGPRGQTIMESCGQPPIVPAIASERDKIPEGLREFVAE